MAAAWDQIRLEDPRYCSFLKLGRNILSLEEETRRAAAQVGTSEAEELGQRRAGPRGDHLDAQVEALGARVVHLRRQLERLDGLAQETAAFGHAFDQMHGRPR